MNRDVYVLGGYQTDFATNWQREDKSLYALFEAAVRGGLEATGLDASDVETGHVGNFVAPLFTGQSHLGGFFGHVDAAMANIPASSHEAACASGSMALLGAMAEIEAGRYDIACVVGIEMMRNVASAQAASNLRGAAWADREWLDTEYIWPCAFDAVLTQYVERYDLDKPYLAAISEKNFANARLNPNAQTRKWAFDAQSFSESDEHNPVVSGRIRRQDCGQITDGAATVFLASAEAAEKYARKRNITLESIPRIKGWRHINAPMQFAEKLKHAEDRGYLFPHVRALFQQTLARASMKGIREVDGLEVHDCFNITEYMILDHCGLNPAGEAWRAIEEGVTARDGSLPVNCSGGLIGLGHPVGASGVRMLLDAYKQSSAQAGDYQIDGAQNIMTVNLGGSATTCASFVVGV